MILCRAVRKTYFHISGRGKTISALSCFPFPAIDINLRVWFTDLLRKIDEEFSPKLIHTVRGVGYVLKKAQD